MANIENLQPGNVNHTLTPEEQHKGGLASVEARREKKIFKQAIAERMGFNDFNEMIDNLIKRAKKSDRSFEVLRDTMGQKPKEEYNINTTLNNPVKGLTKEELDKIINGS